MSQYFESIRCLHGVLQHVSFHQERIARTCAIHNLEMPIIMDCYHSFLTDHQVPRFGLFKWRMSYGFNGIRMDITPYSIKPIKTLQLVEHNTLEYGFKNEDRTELVQISQSVHADDVLIVQNGFLTDTSYGNILLRKGKQWYTPSTYLLPGTMRTFLIASQQVLEMPITKNELKQFDAFKVVNALRPMELVRSRAIDQIWE